MRKDTQRPSRPADRASELDQQKEPGDSGEAIGVFGKVTGESSEVKKPDGDDAIV